jgi:pilus assembly protein CpaF
MSLGLYPSVLSDQFVGKSAELISFLERKDVTDILINGLQSLYLESDLGLERFDSPFRDRQSIYDLIERMILPLGKRIDAAHPYLDGRLVDGSRFHIVLPPIAPHGPLISIRKSKKPEFCPIESFTTDRVVDFLTEAVLSRRNFLISGGTGVGKTTLLSRLIEKIPGNERIVLIEESFEIQVRHPHIVRLEARSPNPDGKGEVTLRALIRNALRMRPDRLILGECRGAEAFDLLQVMNSGHQGSFCTLHANSSRDALRRLEGMVLMSGLDLKVPIVREWIAHTINVVVHLTRERSRQISEMIAVNGLEGEVYRVTPIVGAALSL